MRQNHPIVLKLNLIKSQTVSYLDRNQLTLNFYTKNGKQGLEMSSNVPAFKGKPIKECWLDEQSSFWKQYPKRWMVLSGNTLYSFKDEKSYANVTETFDLKIYNKIVKTADGKTGEFILQSANDSNNQPLSRPHSTRVVSRNRQKIAVQPSYSSKKNI